MSLKKIFFNDFFSSTHLLLFYLFMIISLTLTVVTMSNLKKLPCELSQITEEIEEVSPKLR